MTTYALADLHGYLDLYKQVKEFIQPEDTVIYLGDGGDRGPQPWETIKAILDDPQFIYIKGNHDNMLTTAALNYWGIEWDSSMVYYDLMDNGGKQTWNDMLNDPNNEEYIMKLNSCPIQKTYYSKDKTISLSHAGYTPGRAARDLLWDRKHIYDIVSNNIPDEILVVHGHTPVYYMHGAKTLEDCQRWIRPEFYGNDHKINIDMGTYNTHACCLLNLDTLEYHIFKTKN